MTRWRVRCVRRDKTFVEDGRFETIADYWLEHHRPGVDRWTIETKNAERRRFGWHAPAARTLSREWARYNAARATRAAETASERAEAAS